MMKTLHREVVSLLMLDSRWISSQAIGSLLLSAWVSIPVALQALTLICFLDLLLSMFDPKRALLETLKKDAVAMILCGGMQAITLITSGHVTSPIYLEAASFVPVFYCIIIGIHVMKSVSSVGLPIPEKMLDAASKFEALTGTEKREIHALRLKQQQELDALELAHQQGKADRDAEQAKSGIVK